MDKAFKMHEWKIGIVALLAVMATGTLVLVNVGCATQQAVSVNYGTSKVHSKAELAQAVEVLKADFAKLEGCKLYSLTYAGDERSKQELETANQGRAQDELYTDCIVFDSTFRSPVAGGDAWEANTLYYWNWTLAKTKNGVWIVINKGYC